MANNLNNDHLYEDEEGYDGSSALLKLKAAFHQGLFPFAVERAAKESQLYYGALSVAVLTIGLLLLVETCRRKLDHWAAGWPIFVAVLDGVYRELATLGVVELFIHLLHEYYIDLDVEKEAIFVDIHFVFFYTAIFNALQSTLMAILTHRLSYNTWVVTEELQLERYVEIREEFDRVRTKLYGDNPPYICNSDSGHNRQSIVLKLKNFSHNMQKTSNNQFYDPDKITYVGAFKRFLEGLFYTFKYPRLKAKHDALLVQVRFHELRVHFLQAYDLPHKLKVSTYLMRSLQAVLKHLVHISTMAWLWLTGMINVVYYITGIVVDITQDADSSATTLALYFFSGMAAFVLTSLLVYQRMQIIFMKIMEMKHLWAIDRGTTEEKEASSQGTEVESEDGPSPRASRAARFRDPALASEQLKLFFLGDPNIVITAVQFMQFGFAIALSVIMVYWGEMEKAGFFPAKYYLLIMLTCYVVFAFIMAKTLVRFTMATSLGQLVDRKRLHETVAVYRLEEAERRRQQQKEMNMESHLDHHSGSPKVVPQRAKAVGESVLKAASKVESGICKHRMSGLVKVDAAISSSPFSDRVDKPVLIAPVTSEHFQAPGVGEVPKPSLPKACSKPVTKTSLTVKPVKRATIEPEKAALLMDLVKMDTDALRAAVPVDDFQLMEQRYPRRNCRMSVPDSFGLMSAIGKVGHTVFSSAGDIESKKESTGNKGRSLAASSPFSTFACDDSAVPQHRERRLERKRSISASALIGLMRDTSSDEDDMQWGPQAIVKHCGATNQPIAVEASEVSQCAKQSPPNLPRMEWLKQSELHMQNQTLSKWMGENIEKDSLGMWPILEGGTNVMPMSMEPRESQMTRRPTPPANTRGEEFLPERVACVDDVEEEASDTEKSVTDVSVGCLSDVGEVKCYTHPQNASFRVIHQDVKNVSLVTRLAQMNQKVRNFYLSKLYEFVTHFLGTLICFFLLGMRIEGFLKQQCIIPLADGTWELDLTYSFWMIVALLSFFIVSSTWRLALFPACLDRPENAVKSVHEMKRELLMFIASAIDLVICVTCFIIFTGAEITRCCDGHEYPSDHYGSDLHLQGFVADEQSNTNSVGHAFSDKEYHKLAPAGEHRFRAAASYYPVESQSCEDSTLYCNCLEFGARVEGGLGFIEPWTALIILRMFRFLLAKDFVRLFDLKNKFEEAKASYAESGSRKIQSHRNLKSHGCQAGAELQSGSAVDLWQSAISQYPEIVEQYGEFSSELLQAMLGIEITETQKPGPKTVCILPSLQRAPTIGAANGATRASLCRSESSYRLEEKKYCKLSLEVQEIIVAGKLGCPVKSCRNLEGLLSRELSVVDLGQPVLGAPIEFEVDVAQMEIDCLGLTSEFEFPSARLIRSMRRCERKFLPLLTHWSPVDVVITNHEIVYVHTDDNDGSDSHHEKRVAARQALIATKGGKGLRLCDVTAGRKVIAHMSFSAITSVHVERVLCHPDSMVTNASEANYKMGHGQVEFWQDSSQSDSQESPMDRQKRWESVHEDTLKIETTTGTLYLRFYSDLEDSEAHPERVLAESNGANPVFKDIAFQWAQTIIRLCPQGQLRQAFQYNCTNDDAELTEILQIVPREEKTKSQSHRPVNSQGASRRACAPSLGRSPSWLRRPKSEFHLCGNEDFGPSTLSRNYSNEGGSHLHGTVCPGISRPGKVTRFATYDATMMRESNNTRGEQNTSPPSKLSQWQLEWAKGSHGKQSGYAEAMVHTPK